MLFKPLLIKLCLLSLPECTAGQVASARLLHVCWCWCSCSLVLESCAYLKIVLRDSVSAEVTVFLLGFPPVLLCCPCVLLCRPAPPGGRRRLAVFVSFPRVCCLCVTVQWVRKVFAKRVKNKKPPFTGLKSSFPLRVHFSKS